MPQIQQNVMRKSRISGAGCVAGKFFLLFLTAILFNLLAPGPAFADFHYMAVANPPLLSDISNTPALHYNDWFTVSARIATNPQYVLSCDIVPQEDCSASDWYLSEDPSVSPNPPSIETARVYYYVNVNGYKTSAAFVNMTRDTDTDLWTANVPLAGMVPGNAVTYYIVAMDSVGNVASQSPDPDSDACSDASAWDFSEATPAMQRCASYHIGSTGCDDTGENHIASDCSDNPFSVPDRDDDACGEVSSSGSGDINFSGSSEQMLYGPDQDGDVDLKGFSVASGQGRVCARLGLDAVADSQTIPPPGYAVVFFNPEDMFANTDVPPLSNYFAAAYLPLMDAVDCSLLSKSIWDGACFARNNWDFEDCFSSCYVDTFGPGDKTMDIQVDQGSLTFSMPESGSTPHGSYDFLSPGEAPVFIAAATLELNTMGSNWLSDVTAMMAYYAKNQQAAVMGGTRPPESLTIRCENSDGASAPGVCAEKPGTSAVNTCVLSFNPPLASTGSREFRIYRGVDGDTAPPGLIQTLPDDGGSMYSFRDEINTLDGTRYLYVVTARDTNSGVETIMDYAPRGTCWVEFRDSPCLGRTCAAFRSCDSAGTGCNPVSSVDASTTGEDGQYARTPLPGRSVLIADSDGNDIPWFSAITDADGNFELFVNPDLLNAEKTHYLILRLSTDDSAYMPCDPAFSNGCSIVIRKFGPGQFPTEGAMRVATPHMPVPGGGRAEIGNANCDRVIDISDMVILKQAFGSGQGDAGFQTYADFNGDGAVDVTDFLILKDHLGLELPQAPAPDSTLCKP